MYVYTHSLSEDTYGSSEYRIEYSDRPEGASFDGMDNRASRYVYVVYIPTYSTYLPIVHTYL